VPLPLAIGAFLTAAAVITVAGVLIAETSDRLADRTGMGEALFGGILLGGSTSIPGIVTSIASAANDHPELAYSNAVGGIAAQTFFLVLADATYRRANLEHAAASLTNLAQAGVLVSLLCLPMLAAFTPPFALAGVHPVTPVMFAGYLLGIRLAVRTGEKPMWGPKRTRETRLDVPDEPQGGRRALRVLGLRFATLAAVLTAAGYVTAESGIAIADETGLTQTVVGAFFTAVTTSIPELVTTIAAVRRGALTLAVGGIIGGNMFDTLFIASSDIAYRDGSLYHAVSALPYFLTAVSILMTAILMLGMLRRERHGIAGIGFESALVLVLYLGATAVVILAG
jgi:cation:H+ antiporter